MAADASNQLFTQPKFPSKPLLPTNKSTIASTTKKSPTASLTKPADNKMQLVGIGLIVIGLILLAFGIMTWK